MVLLPGGQYARGKERSISTRRRISLWLQGSLFCTANGSYFVFWGLRRSCRAGLGVAALGCCQDASWAETYDGRPKTERLLSPPETFWSISFHKRIRPIRGRKRIHRTGRFIFVYRLAMDAKNPKGWWWGLTENIQACLRIFWQLQHLWLARDILHLPQGVFAVFVNGSQEHTDETLLYDIFTNAHINSIK